MRLVRECSSEQLLEKLFRIYEQTAFGPDQLENREGAPRQMPVTVDASGLPAPVALILRPWGGVLETALPGMGENVRVTADNASMSLWRRVVMLPRIERGLATALSASAVFAVELNKRGPAMRTLDLRLCAHLRL